MVRSSYFRYWMQAAESPRVNVEKTTQTRRVLDLIGDRAGWFFEATGSGRAFVIVNWINRKEGDRVYIVTNASNTYQDQGKRFHVKKGSALFEIKRDQFRKLSGGIEPPSA